MSLSFRTTDGVEEQDEYDGCEEPDGDHLTEYTENAMEQNRIDEYPYTW